MKRAIILFSLLVTLSSIAKADSRETVTINGTVVNKNTTHIAFSGNDVILTFSDGTSQTADISQVRMDFDHVAIFKDKDYDNVETIKTYGGKTLKTVVNRALTAGEWATICLPFSMSASDITASFGSGTQVAILESASYGAINFTSAEKMTAGMPYLIKPTKNLNSFTLDAVEISDWATGYRMEGEAFQFVGAVNAVSQEGSIYYIASGNKFCYLSRGDIYPLRAFFIDTADSDNKGDVNGDSRVNVADVMATVNYVLGKAPTAFIFAKADINQDNNVNVSDVMSIVKIILFGGQTIKTDIPITLDGVAINFSDGGEGDSSDQAANQSHIEQILN